MIDYGSFVYAGPPRTGSTWFLHACYAAGLGNGWKSQVHWKALAEINDRPYIVSVRHPVKWLESYFRELSPGATGIPSVDVFVQCHADSFDEFIRKYLELCPGAVSAMFQNYGGKIHHRIEDQPRALQEFLLSMDLRRQDVEKIASINRVNTASKPQVTWNPSLLRKVQEVEREAIEHYEYTTF